LPSRLRIVVRLQSQPAAIGEPEEPAQPQIGIGGDGALAGQELADALRAHSELLRKTVVAHAQRLQELLGEHLARRHRLEFPALLFLPQ
jgi:hypothetical protein